MTGRRRSGGLGALLFAGAAGLLVHGDPALAQGRTWLIESFEAEVRVYRSGLVEVTETIRPRFQGTFNGIYRLIPVEYRTPNLGFEYDLRLDVEEVDDGAGNALRYEVSRQRHYRKIKVWIPGAVDATKTVRIRYRAGRALRFHEGDEVTPAYDELYWNVTGDEWPVPIEAARAVIHLPTQVAGIRARAWTGPYGSTEQEADVVLRGSQVRVNSRRSLSYREGLTVAVAWEPGVIERPTAVDEARFFLLANWPLLLPALALVLMFRRWQARGRDPDPGSVAPRYEPPRELTPAEVGVIADNSPDMRDITATLVDLAVRGYVVIEETEQKKLLGMLSDRDYLFRLLRPAQEWGELRSHERKLLDALFSGAAEVRLSELENRFYKDLPSLKDRLMGTLVREGVYRQRPDRVTARYLGAAVVATALILVLGFLGGERLGLASVAVTVSAIATGVVVAGFAFLMPARTVAGARLLAEVRGFEEFLDRVESDRFRRMITGPEMFEQYLPYAMALGVEKKWASAFEGMSREPPTWYVGSGYPTFHPSLFVADLGRMSDRAGTVMRSAPRSSGGSGFGGGGGFSGGGFGGGGGGAF
ncbi:MAG: DUF2207 domain-containing protein [Gemmatimonadota bacterium]